MITHRFATAADIDEYYGERPGRTLKAIAILMDGKPVAMLGLAIEAERAVAFSEYKPELEPHLKSMGVLRAIKKAERLISDSLMPVVALCTTDSGILSRLGFVRVNDEVYLWPN